MAKGSLFSSFFEGGFLQGRGQKKVMTLFTCMVYCDGPVSALRNGFQPTGRKPGTEHACLTKPLATSGVRCGLCQSSLPFEYAPSCTWSRWYGRCLVVFRITNTTHAYPPMVTLYSCSIIRHESCSMQRRRSPESRVLHNTSQHKHNIHTHIYYCISYTITYQISNIKYDILPFHMTS